MGRKQVVWPILDDRRLHALEGADLGNLTNIATSNQLSGVIAPENISLCGSSLSFYLTGTQSGSALGPITV